MNYKVGEVEFEKNWVENELPKYGWKYNVELCNKTTSDLLLQFKQLLEKKNNIKFSDIDWNKFCEKLESPSLVKRMGYLKEPLHFTFENNETIDFVLIDWFNPQNNLYECIYETTDINKRYDVTFLINKIPILHCELKKPGYVDIWQAFNQIKRYKKDNMHFLYKFTMMYMISDGISTMFFANNDNIEKKDPKMWSDEENKKIGDIEQLQQIFLKPDILTDYLNRFCLIDNKQLILSRSYQYHAVKNCFKQILQTNESGYIFHATGSGKTLTSFLLSRDLSRESKIDKVLFVIDRNDLGEQTQEEFKKYTAFGTKLETKYDVENTNDLIKKLQNKNEKLIITSIQKLNNACSKARKQEIIESIKNKKIVFIYDECHRSQAGDMRKNIDDIFNKPQAIGFTGTPIYETSQTSSEIRTVDIFGDCLHTYSFNDAVSDSNVVPYDIDFPVNLKYTKDAEKKFVETVDWKNFYKNDKWIDAVCSYVKQTFMDLTQNKKYGAMLTLGSIDEAYKCWKWFKENYQDINVGCIFSTEPNGEESEEDMKTGKEKLQEILESYNKEYGANYSINNYYSYQGNLANNIKNGVVDLTIVVNVFTTGFDAKRINTMYIAKELKMHNIIQTFARSCRNYENKQIANIRCLLRTSKKDVKEAFGYYAKGVDVEKIIKPYVMDYTKIVNLINLIIDQIINIAPTPEDARNNQSDDFVKQYIQLIRKLSFNIDNFFLTFDEKQWSDLKLSYDTILQYRSIAGSLLQKYKEIIAIENKSINPNSYIEEIEMNELVNKSIITNNDWLNKIAKSKTKEERKKNLQILINEICINENMISIAQHIKKRLEHYLGEVESFDYKEVKQQMEIVVNEQWNYAAKQIADKYQIDFEFIKEYFQKYKDKVLTKNEKDCLIHCLNSNVRDFESRKQAEKDIEQTFDSIIIQQNTYSSYFDFHDINM